MYISVIYAKKFKLIEGIRTSLKQFAALDTDSQTLNFNKYCS